jgi:ribonuclease HII
VLYFEKMLKKKGRNVIIGVDEAGRGPLAGPVVAAAVCLKSNRFKNRIDDSKKLTALQRENAYFEIIEKSHFGIGIINEKVIDRINILESTKLAMEQAVFQLTRKLTVKSPRIHVLIDGYVRLNTSLPCTFIIKGDGRSKSIASASILAKVTRDRIMLIYDKVFPQYGFIRHKGYPTKAHKNAIKKFGSSIIHRMTFSSV